MGLGNDTPPCPWCWRDLMVLNSCGIYKVRSLYNRPHILQTEIDTATSETSGLARILSPTPSLHSSSCFVLNTAGGSRPPFQPDQHLANLYPVAFAILGWVSIPGLETLRVKLIRRFRSLYQKMAPLHIRRWSTIFRYPS